MKTYYQLTVDLELTKIANIELTKALEAQAKEIDNMEKVLHNYEDHIKGLEKYIELGGANGKSY